MDPLDGTKEFKKRNGQFTVNIGLCKSGEPMAGVVYCPALDPPLMYKGAKGLGPPVSHTHVFLCTCWSLVVCVGVCAILCVCVHSVW